ncbi:MAG: hypothetical protein Q7S84_04930 [bacterium]|nr:hypothetical protein [bacterium]
MEHRSRLIKGAFILFLLIIALIIIGVLTERKPERQPTEAERREEIIKSSYQKPTEVRQLTGTILSVIGATIQFEAPDPLDYQPHSDGTPQRTTVRFVTVTKNTKLTELDIRGKNGIPTTKTITLSDFTPGDTVTVVADHNILTATEFDAVEVRTVVK